MALSATLLFYFQLTKSGAGVTGKSGSITATIKKLTRGSSPTITTVTTGGAITVGSVTEVDATNAKGLYVVGVVGLDPAADYIAAAHYTGTATDVDLADVPALWSEFSPSVNAGAMPQVAAGAANGMAVMYDSSGVNMSHGSSAAINDTVFSQGAADRIWASTTRQLTGTQTFNNTGTWTGGITGNINGNVTGTIGGFTAAALASLVQTDTGLSYEEAQDGSIVFLSRVVPDSAFLAEFVTVDTGQTSASAGSVAKLSQGSGSVTNSDLLKAIESR